MIAIISIDIKSKLFYLFDKIIGKFVFLILGKKCGPELRII